MCEKECECSKTKIEIKTLKKWKGRNEQHKEENKATTEHNSECKMHEEIVS